MRMYRRRSRSAMKCCSSLRPRDVLNRLVPQYAIGLVFGSLLQSVASEHCARLSAMQKATQNADDMLKRLKQQFNTARRTCAYTGDKRNHRRCKRHQGGTMMQKVNIGEIVHIAGLFWIYVFKWGEEPPIHNLLAVEETTVFLEVAAHVERGIVRTVALEATEGLRCGQKVMDTGSGIMVPVGEGVLGRVVDVLGRPIDAKGIICVDESRPIHREAPPLMAQKPATEILETGIKVNRFAYALSQGRKNRPVWRRRRGKKRCSSWK